MIVTAGKTNVSVYVYFVDDDGGTAPGEPTTGLLFSNIETGGSASYCRQGAARTDFTLVTLASASAAHTDGGFILVDDTNMPGLYRLDLPDAAFVTGVDQVIVHLVAAAGNNTIMRPLAIDITNVDLRDAVRGGMTALPNANADAAGGLPISDLGGLDLDAMNTNINDIETDTNELQTDWTNAGRLDAILDELTVNIDAVEADTQDLQTQVGAAGAGLTGLPDVTIDATSVDLIWDENIVLAHTTADTAGKKLADAGGAADPWATALPGAYGAGTAGNIIGNDVPAILVDTAEIGTAGAGLTSLASQTSVNTIDTNLDAVLVDTAEIGTAGAGLSNITINDASVDKVWDETMAGHITADTSGLVMNDLQDGGRLDLILDSRMAEASINTTGGAVDNVTTVATTTTNTDMRGTDGANTTTPPTAAAIADAVWDEVITTGQHNQANTAGRLQRLASDVVLIDSAVDTTVYGASTTTEFGTDLTQVDDFFNDTVIIFTSGALLGQSRTILNYAQTNGVITLDEPLTSAPLNNVEFSLKATHVHPITQIVNSVLDELLSGHTTAGSLGKAITDIEADTNELQTDDVPTLISNLDAVVDTVKVDTAAILVDTNELQTDLTDGGRLDLILDAVALEATVAALNDISTAQVNAEVVDVLKTDTVTLPAQGAPPVTPTMEQMVSWLYKVLRNRTSQTATTWSLYNDAETVVDSKATVSDDGTTAIKQEIVSGP